jgi:hypothetical protein
MKTRKANLPGRDASQPVLELVDGIGYQTAIYIAGPKETIDQRPGDCAFGPNSLVVRISTAGGQVWTEYELHDPVVWGWIGRLIGTDCDLRSQTPTDIDLSRATQKVARQ